MKNLYITLFVFVIIISFIIPGSTFYSTFETYSIKQSIIETEKNNDEYSFIPIFTQKQDRKIYIPLVYDHYTYGLDYSFSTSVHVDAEDMKELNVRVYIKNKLIKDIHYEKKDISSKDYLGKKYFSTVKNSEEMFIGKEVADDIRIEYDAVIISNGKEKTIKKSIEYEQYVNHDKGNYLFKDFMNY